MSGGFYRAFEDRYRGSRAVVGARLRAYLPFLDALATLAPRPAALDLGCGRGEWLELLAERGFAARGVDLDDGMLAACRERGLDAVRADAVASLRALPDDSLELVSAFHLVEHIPFEVLQDLIAEARRVLRPGGLLIMETPNPENLSVGATSFYLDPSHERPLPPLLLGFLAEYSGYGRQRTVRLQESAALHGDAPIGLIEVLEGVSPDYAIVAQKAAPAALLAPFDAAFAQPFGYALGDVAARYEQLQAQRRDALHGGLAQQQQALHSLEHGVAELGAHVAAHRVRLPGIDAELKQLERRAGDGELALAALAGRHDALAISHDALAGRHDTLAASHAAQAGVLAARLDALEQRSAAAEARAEALGQHVVALLSSSSWRITAPWRLVGGYAHRLRAARRDRRLLSGVKRRLRTPLLALMQAVRQRPGVTRAARALLRLSPALEARLRGLQRQQDASQAVLPAEPPRPPGDMSPRTLRHFRDLKSSLETRPH